MPAPFIGTGVTGSAAFGSGYMLDFSPVIGMLDSLTVPLQSMLADEACFETKVEWQDEESLAARSKLSTAISATTTTDIVVVVEQRERFEPGDAILVNDEYMRITLYSSAANTLVVTRGAFGSTIATTHAVGSDIIGLGQVQNEEAAINASRQRDRTPRFNLTQVFGRDKISISGTQRAVRKYGIVDEFTKQVSCRLMEVPVEVEQAAWYGRRSGEGTKQRSMGGFTDYITTNVNASLVTDFTEDQIGAALQTLYEAGVDESNLVIACSPRARRRFNSFSGGGVIQVDMSNGTRGSRVEFLRNPFGADIRIVHSRFIRQKDMFIFDRNNVKFRTLRNLQLKPLGNTLDADEAIVLLEKTLQFEKERHAFRFSNLAFS